MKIRVIHNEEAHEAALREMEHLMEIDPAPGSEKFGQMELLALVIKDYESRCFAIASPDPVEAIRFRMEQQGITRRELEKCLGSRARVSEILNRRRGLSVSMVRNLYLRLHIPAEILIGKSSLRQGTRRVKSKAAAKR